MSKIITQQIYSKGGTNSKEYKELEKKWQDLEDTKKDTDDIFIKIANVLGVKKGTTEYSYQGIYKAFEKKVGKPKKWGLV